MKDKLNKKTILIIIGALLLIAVAILLFSLFGNKDKFKSDYEEVEKNIKDTLINFKAGYVTEYTGIEKLFEEKEIDIENINNENKFVYVLLSILEREQEEISDEVYEKLENKLENLDDYFLINGTTIKNEMKNLLNIEWTHRTIKDVKNFIYDIEYDSNTDVYIVTPSKYYEQYEETIENSNKTVELEIIESSSTNKEIKTTIAVAYVAYDSKDDFTTIIKFYSDKEQKNLIFEINSNDMYILNDEGEYVKNENVDSIKKHSDKFKKFVVTSTKENDKFFITNIKQK